MIEADKNKYGNNPIVHTTGPASEKNFGLMMNPPQASRTLEASKSANLGVSNIQQIVQGI